MTFEDFHKKLTADTIWADEIKVKHGKKDLMGLSHECYIWLLTQTTRWKAQDYGDFRRAYQKFLIYAPDRTEVVDRQYEKAKPVEIHPQAITDEEEIQKRLAEWKKSFDKIGNIKRVKSSERERIFHVAQQIKKIDYTPLSKEDVYKRDRHLEWVKHCFNYRTGEPNEKFMPEHEFNELYDKNEI